MLPRSVEEIVEDIEADHTSGAAHIASVGLKALEALLKETGGRPSPEAIREAVHRVAEAQRTNAALYNAAQLFAQLVADGQDPVGVLAHLREELESARSKVARNFLKIAPESASVVTLTFSANVLATLQILAEKRRLEHVHVMESRPMMEGRFLVVALTEAGIPATLVPDALGPSLLARSSCALVGADSVLRDGSVVNKIGSYALGLAAADHKKPFYVACETLKFDMRYDAATMPEMPTMPPKELWDRPPERIDVLSRYFEVVPSRLVTMVVTERGSYAPETIRTILAQGKQAKGQN